MEDGLTGAVIHHPLESWDAWKGFSSPDPDAEAGWGTVDWNRVAQDLGTTKAKGRVARGSLRHGHTFLSLIYLRGYENVILDMADGEPRLWELVRVLEDFNASVVRHYLELGVEWMGYPEDLGMQVGPMLSPQHFRTYIRPSYERLMAPAREAGCIVHMHSDGDIRALIDDLVLGGVEVVNLQDLVNGIDWIEARLAGRTCIDLDIDRQRVTRFGTPAQIDALIRQEVELLARKEGGLMMTFGLYPGTPLDNVAALMDAMTRYATTYS
jgi:uroporphyrinogen-III decarboxylase